MDFEYMQLSARELTNISFYYYYYYYYYYYCMHLSVTAVRSCEGGFMKTTLRQRG